MYPEGNLFIRVSHGRLEAIVKEPVGQSSGAALVMHPLPTGGNDHNKVVYRAASALNEAGLVTLRINFRGVGQSTSNLIREKANLTMHDRHSNTLASNTQTSPSLFVGFPLAHA